MTMSMRGVRDGRGFTISSGRSRELGRAILDNLPRPWHPSNVLFRVSVALFQACPFSYIGLAPETH